MWDSSHTHTHHTINQIGASQIQTFLITFLQTDDVVTFYWLLVFIWVSY